MSRWGTRANDVIGVALSGRAGVTYEEARALLAKSYPAAWGPKANAPYKAWCAACGEHLRSMLPPLERCEARGCGRRGIRREPRVVGMVTVAPRLCERHSR